MADIEANQGYLRFRYRDLEPLVVTGEPNKAFAQYVSLAPATPLGHLRVTITATPQTGADLGIPAGTKRLEIFNLSTDTNVYYTDLAGQSPSPALGFPIPFQAWFKYDTDLVLADFKLATSSGSASLALACYA